MKKIFLLLILVLFISGCDELENVIFGETQKIETIINETITDEITIASFNAQIFGDAKMRNEYAVEVLDDIINRYDVIALQEIRDASGDSIENLVARHPHKEYVVSERTGRTKSKEQYAYIYDTRKINILDTYTFLDTTDVFEREPFVAHLSNDNLDFVMIQIHTKPDDTEEEIKNLDYVWKSAKGKYNNSNIILLGDLNADCLYYDEGHDLSELLWLIESDADTTTSKTDCAYDRILVSESIDDITQDFGVDYLEHFHIDQVKETSDHYPIFIEIE